MTIGQSLAAWSLPGKGLSSLAAINITAHRTHTQRGTTLIMSAPSRTQLGSLEALQLDAGGRLLPLQHKQSEQAANT